MSARSSQSAYQDLIRSWQRHAPWYRRASARLGLQGKLLLCFMSLLTAALGGSCYLFVSMSSERLSDMMGEQARQIAYTLAQAGKSPLATGQYDELRVIGQDLLKTRNILFVAFLDDGGRVLSLASRDPDYTYGGFDSPAQDVQSLMRVRRQTSAAFGSHLEVVAPVLRLTGPPATGGVRLVGYVALGLSQTREQEQLTQSTFYAMGIGCGLAVVMLPLAYALVRRVFQPIRQLVEATMRIAAGDLGAQVEVHRPDVIGVLARSFNEMVQRVRSQQEALAGANERLAQANRSLEGKVRQRTAQLEAANRRLSGEIAEKEDFLRAVSHDLNAPLRNISGMATMLLMKYRDALADDAVHRLERIQRNVEMETDLIGELLELSRIKTRRQKMEAVEIDALVRELGEMLEDDLRTRGITLTIDTPLPVLHCEKARLRQVFQNLIDNAIKYMGEGAASAKGPVKEIHVGCTVRASEAEFYVRDTGMGIDPEDVGKVFNVFRRGRNGVARNVAGKGVGLSSVKSIVETYNGSIWVESRVGEGSTFRFTVNGMHVMGATVAAGSGAADQVGA